jgi:hypothetical protein
MRADPVHGDMLPSTSRSDTASAIVTLLHGTFARSAAWTSPDSALCSSVRNAAAKAGVQVELRNHLWTGSNSVRAREEAARTLVERLKCDLKDAPQVAHFLIAHSHGGNIAIDVARAPDVAGRLRGIVTLSTPFVSCRRSGVRIAAAVLGALLSIVFVVFGSVLALMAQFWGWEWLTGYSLVPSNKLELSVFVLLFGLISSVYSLKIAREASSEIWNIVSDFQDSVLARFDRSLTDPVPMLCVRLGIDEALAALWTARVLVKPARMLTVLTSWMAAAGGLVYLALWPTAVCAMLIFGVLDRVYGSHLFTSVGPSLHKIQISFGLLCLVSIPLALLFLSLWAVFGYLMGSLTLGHWGGLFAQLLADFRITAVPEGAAATSKVYPPWALRLGLRHSLVYADRRALADISEWMVARLAENRERASA